MSNEAIDRGLQQIAKEQKTPVPRNPAEEAIIEHTKNARGKASAIINDYGKYDNLSRRVTPDIAYQQKDGSKVAFHLVGMTPIREQGIPVFQQVLCVESDPTKDSDYKFPVVFQLIFNKGIWHDNTDVRTPIQFEFIDSVLTHIEKGCIEKRAQKA